MKNYEKPIAVVTKFEVEDIIAASMLKATDDQIKAVTGEESDGILGFFLDWF